ncbi:MAG: hypothetical protein HY401_04565 [Elusimicrobia bacterium]|nr:hypothetical protein [Elusimicrobiota bacterium]
MTKLKISLIGLGFAATLGLAVPGRSEVQKRDGSELSSKPRISPELASELGYILRHSKQNYSKTHAGFTEMGFILECKDLNYRFRGELVNFFVPGRQMSSTAMHLWALYRGAGVTGLDFIKSHFSVTVNLDGIIGYASLCAYDTCLGGFPDSKRYLQEATNNIARAFIEACGSRK